MQALIIAIAASVATAASAAPPAAVPGWKYHGFTSFPAAYFGANMTGPPNATELAFVARHQLAGFGWQASMATRWPGAAPWEPPANGGSLPANYSYSEEAVLAADAARLSRYARAHAPTAAVDAAFVYRQASVANWWFADDRAMYGGHAEFFLRDAAGRLCWRDGPFYDWTAPGAPEYYLGHHVQTLCDEASRGGGGGNGGGLPRAVFFDGVDTTARASGQIVYPHHTNCTLNLTKAKSRALYAGAIDWSVRVGKALNDCGVLPIYSLGGAMDPAIAADRGYIASEQGLVRSLAAAKVSWARYYEFWSWWRAGYGIANALNETAQGVPSVPVKILPMAFLD